jgi:Leucine-rich repeat (LRR) protein
LDYLDLPYNEIEIIYPKAFHGLAKLKNIDLSHNNLDYFAPNIFSNNPVLETVSFVGNQLVYFPGCPPILASLSIISLDLSYCNLTSINADTFSQLSNLSVLSLNSNHLREINWDNLEPLRELINVDLGNNRWKCDCKILEVLSMLSNRRKSLNLTGEHKQVTCYKDGEYNIISTADIEKYCTGEEKKRTNTYLEPKPGKSPAKETSTIFVPKEDEKNVDKPESGNSNLITLIGIIVSFLFCIIFLFTVLCYINSKKKWQILLKNFWGRKRTTGKKRESSGENPLMEFKEKVSDF